MSDGEAFVGTEVAAERLEALKSRPGMADQVAEIRDEMRLGDEPDTPLT